MTFSVPANRIVVFLSPVFIGLAGWVVVLAAKYMPGHPKLDQGQLTALFILGASWVSAHLLLWLRGWQAHEARAGPPRADTPKTPPLP